MTMKPKEPLIFLIAGQARHGKDTISMFIREYYLRQEKLPESLQFSYYIKDFVKRLTDWDGTEETKDQYRSEMQRLGTEIVRKQIDPKFFIKRTIEDIRVYSYYCDVLTISDVRFPSEIEDIKKEFPCVISILVQRPNFESPLSDKEKQHETETALNHYNQYDYVLINDGTISELKEKVTTMLKEVEKNEFKR